MKKILIIFSVVILAGCYTVSDKSGFISGDIYLKGADTLYVPIGSKTASDVAWLDDSTLPVEFKIENIRLRSGQRAEEFYRQFPTVIWQQAYDMLTDKTMADVEHKLVEVDSYPLTINPVNGQIRILESTKDMNVSPGDVFHVDVSVSNSKGSVFLEDYAIIKITEKSDRPYILIEIINGICIQQGGYQFPYYDQINEGQPDFITRRDNIYDDNGIEFCRISKISDEPEIGVKVHLKFLDSNGRLFDAAKYSTYPGQVSHLDYGLDRQNTDQGVVVQFPTLPWPVIENPPRTYFLMGPYEPTFDKLDLASLKAAHQSGTIPTLVNPWPADDWAGAQGWFVRTRSRITFYESGTWEITCTVPFTDVNGGF